MPTYLARMQAVLDALLLYCEAVSNTLQIKLNLQHIPNEFATNGNVFALDIKNTIYLLFLFLLGFLPYLRLCLVKPRPDKNTFEPYRIKIDFK